MFGQEPFAAKLLNTLKAAYYDPLVSQSSDERLKAHNADIGILAAHLLTECIDQPALRRQTMRDFTDITPALEKLLTRHGVGAEAVGGLRAPRQPDDATQIEAYFKHSRTLLFELQRIAKPEALARKRGRH
jgi:hypothetical protein